MKEISLTSHNIFSHKRWITYVFKSEHFFSFNYPPSEFFVSHVSLVKDSSQSIRTQISILFLIFTTQRNNILILLYLCVKKGQLKPGSNNYVRMAPHLTPPPQYMNWDLTDSLWKRRRSRRTQRMKDVSFNYPWVWTLRVRVET